MPLPLLAIAGSAVKIGKKIFGFFKARKEKKAAKKQAKADMAKNNLAKYNEQAAALGLNFGGATPITEGAAVLDEFLKNKAAPGEAPAASGGFDFKSPPVLIGIVVLCFVLLKAMKIIK